MGFEVCFTYGAEFLVAVRTILDLYGAYGINDNVRWVQRNDGIALIDYVEHEYIRK